MYARLYETVSCGESFISLFLRTLYAAFQKLVNYIMSKQEQPSSVKSAEGEIRHRPSTEESF